MHLTAIFEELEKQSPLPEDTLKADSKILQKGRLKPIGETLGQIAGCCGGCLPHIERIVEQKRQQAAGTADGLIACQTSPCLSEAPMSHVVPV